MTSPSSPRVSVVLVNFNDRQHLEACLSSLRMGASPLAYDVTLVDNASADGSAEMAASRFPEVRLIRNTVNVGFGRANNQAAAESRAEFLLFLNTDTVMGAGAVAALVKEMQRDSRAGAAGPALIRAPGRYQVSFGRRVDFLAQLLQKTVINPYRKIQLRFARKTRKTGWLSAACLLCRREAFAAVGGFDERFFIYFEDIDLCFRMRKAGWRLLHVPSARVVHEGGATTRPRFSSSRLEYRRSQVLFYEKNNSRTSLALLRGYLRTGLALRGLGGVFRGPEGRKRREDYRALLRGGGEDR